MTIRVMPLILVAALLAGGSGCAKPDWIQDTLVTVDVTGTWHSASGAFVELRLEQQGSKVRGSVRQAIGSYSGPIEGTVSGDLFTFKGTGTATNLAGRMRVSGDEMSGLFAGGAGSFDFHFRRVTSPAPPSSQQQ